MRRSRLTSLNTMTVPAVWPVRSRIGATVAWIGTSRPRRLTSAVWSARCTGSPLASAWLTGSSTISLLPSFTSFTISVTFLPQASSEGQPVIFSAIGLM